MGVKTFELTDGEAKFVESKKNLVVSETTSYGAYEYRDAEGKKQKGDIIYRALGPNHMIREAIFEDGSRVLEFDRRSNGKKIQIPISNLNGGRFYSVDPETGRIRIGNRHGTFIDIDPKTEEVTQKTLTLEPEEGAQAMAMKEVEVEIPFYETQSATMPLDAFVRKSRAFADYAPYMLYLDSDTAMNVNHLYAKIGLKESSGLVSILGLDKDDRWNSIHSADEKLAFVKVHHDEVVLKSDPEVFKKTVQPLYKKLSQSLMPDAYLERLGVTRDDIAGLKPDERFEFLHRKYVQLQKKYHSDVTGGDAKSAHISTGLNESDAYFDKNRNWE